MAQHQLSLQPIEGLSDPDNFLKVPLRGTFKKLSGFYGSARRCIEIGFIIRTAGFKYLLIIICKFMF
jgi:hypothetical protein